ncbi:hypothetical protein WH50_24900 [Pokkaliibacter plantistimulans]|uniref:MaoC-like domain-containing protein n=1 Tax=Pokkaliibacter plantistimulans TaxID=1635171 RepID=A0ABX5LR68_9GAMM|nr:MaoC family dehydratase [Pokkaliibacter plantistimulans]PXF28697.1 hypothetical protein WH50_24900 [Pokkaliibacter plantistimulans]
MTPYQGHYLEDLAVGMSDCIAKTISESDILQFADITGDTNPIHIDAEYAATTTFGKQIAHGMLAGGLISAVLGTRLPGPGAIYLEQHLEFKLPIHIGDTITATATIEEIDLRRKKVKLTTNCTTNGKTVAQGYAIVMVNKRPKPASS